MTASVILVDSSDKAVGVQDKKSAHEQGLLHRAFSVFIFYQGEQEPELLIQQRQKDKYHSANLWTNTCCSHPEPGEEVLTAGRRRLLEEMGLDLPLQDVGGFHYTVQFDNGLCENEMDHVLIGYAVNKEVVFNTHEVQAIAWKPISHLLESMIAEPQLYTAWFLPALEIALRNV